MNEMEIQYAASSLFDGGWRKKDRENLIEEYQLTEEEANSICELLQVYEAL